MRKTEKVLVTSGDPHGIGVEIILKGIDEPNQYSQFLILGSKKVYSFYQSCLNIKRPINIINAIADIPFCFDPTTLNIVDIPYDSPIKAGELTQSAGEHALRCIDTAIHLIKEGFSSILITAPVNKEAIIKTNKSFIGHTEYLAQAFNINDVTMILVSDKLKVALVTTHMPLKRVSESISIEKIIATLKNSNHFLNEIGLLSGRIAVCALNPHGGEGGHFGNEESSIIVPAIEEAKKLGINVFGPYPADTLFSQGDYDLYVAIYHDQGLIPFKQLSFGQGVNITLGLPFTRVSVDHGTAFEIAGKGEANHESMKNTIHWALLLQKQKEENLI